MTKFLLDEIQKSLSAKGIVSQLPCGMIESKRFSFDGKSDCGFKGKEKYVFIRTKSQAWVSKSVDGIGFTTDLGVRDLVRILAGIQSVNFEVHKI
jgi:hypothetical protein